MNSPNSKLPLLSNTKSWYELLEYINRTPHDLYIDYHINNEYELNSICNTSKPLIISLPIKLYNNNVKVFPLSTVLFGLENKKSLFTLNNSNGRTNHAMRGRWILPFKDVIYNRPTIIAGLEENVIIGIGFHYEENKNRYFMIWGSKNSPTKIEHNEYDHIKRKTTLVDSGTFISRYSVIKGTHASAVEPLIKSQL